MRIRGANEASPRRTSRELFRFSLKWALILAGLSLVIAYSATLIVVGMTLFRAVQPRLSNGAARAVIRDVPAHLVASAMNHLEAVRHPSELERIHLDIAFKDLEKLRAKRAEALRLGNLITSDDDFVKASIRHGDESIRTEIRLKGDLLDHLDGDKWSFRVHVRKGDQLFGMRRFSLQSPAVRDFQGESIFLEHLRREGILAPRYFFVDLTVNGKDIGVMAIEEHFSKELLESQQRREGVILRFDENPFWMNRNLNGTFGPFNNPYVATLKPFRSGKVSKSPNLSADLDVAIGLMRGFMDRMLGPRDVFDLELMARFVAIVEIWNAHHALSWHNMRFYYNPLTARLEPVGFDAHLSARPQGPGLVARTGHFIPLLLEHEVFREVFVRELARLSDELVNGDLATWARTREAELLPTLQEGLEYIAPLPIDSLKRRATNLTRITLASFEHFLPPLGRPDMLYPEPVKAYVCTECVPPRIELVNALPVPVSVLSISAKQSGAVEQALAPVEGVEVPFDVPPTAYQGSPTPIRVPLASDLDPQAFDLEAVVRVSGQGQKHSIGVVRYPIARRASALPAAALAEALARHPFLNWEGGSNRLRVDAGVWDVEGSLVLPEGVGLLLMAGVELRFAEGESLVSSGALLFRGTAEKPVRLRPSEGHETWGGLASIRSEAAHSWNHVVVEATAGIARSGWRPTGGVTLRGADVKISNSVFRGNRSEDALNLVRSEFELENVEFDDTSSDAVDADFSNGVIRGGSFSEIGGDGIDVSGAKIEVDGVELVDIADKAISVGEASRVHVHDVRIERVATGVASKDRSELFLEDSLIGTASVAGVTVFTKKPEYGPASATLEDVEMNAVAREVLVQMGSNATVDGEAVAEVPLDTDTLY